MVVKKIVRLIVITIIFGIISWTGFWWMSATQLETTIKKWFGEETLSEKRDFAHISVRGYPSRLDATLSGVDLAWLDNDLSLRIPILQFIKLIYDKKLTVIAAKPPITIKVGNSQFSINGDLIKSSLKLDHEGSLEETIIESENLNIKANNGFNYHIEETLIAYRVMKNSGQSKDTFYVGTNVLPLESLLSKSRLVKSTKEKLLTKINISGDLGFIGKDPENALLKKIAKISDLTIIVKNRIFESSLKGDISFSQDGQLNAKIEMVVQDWKTFLDYIYQHSLLDSEQLRVLRAGLTFIGSQRNLPNQPIKIPIKIKNNVLFVGPLKVINLGTLIEPSIQLF